MKTITKEEAIVEAKRALEENYAFDFDGYDMEEQASAIGFALYRMDDKPSQCWARFYHFAKSRGDEDAMDACALMFWMGKTPEALFKIIIDTLED